MTAFQESRIKNHINVIWKLIIYIWTVNFLFGSFRYSESVNLPKISLASERLSRAIYYFDEWLSSKFGRRSRIKPLHLCKFIPAKVCTNPPQATPLESVAICPCSILKFHSFLIKYRIVSKMYFDPWFTCFRCMYEYGIAVPPCCAVTQLNKGVAHWLVIVSHGIAFRGGVIIRLFLHITRILPLFALVSQATNLTTFSDFLYFWHRFPYIPLLA